MNQATGSDPQATPPPPSGSPVIQSQMLARKPVYKKPWFIAMIAVFLGIFVFVGLSSSGENTGTEMAEEPEIISAPSVTGLRLDIALSDFDALGVGEGDIEIVGGGTLGILDESNWVICEQQPAANAPLEEPFRFIVDRTCPETNAASEDNSAVEEEADPMVTEETLDAEPVPDSPTIFTASVLGDIADMRKDINDLEIAIAENGVLRILGNITEINFNYAQLGGSVPPEAISDPWMTDMMSLDASVTKLTEVVTSDGTKRQVNVAIKDVRANLESLEALAGQLD